MAGGGRNQAVGTQGGGRSQAVGTQSGGRSQTVIAQGEAGFKRGSITRLKLTNFLTYNDCAFSFNPRLNIIIGPNGTGKSSVVCAICLGLGGKTSILSRAKDIGEFIKHGKDRARIVIELYNPNGNDVICREIQMQLSKCTSTWYLNNNQVSHKHIEEFVCRTNTNLSNLCQFLAQERVSDFAKMNKIEMLLNTEEAICSDQMKKDRKWLSNFRQDEKALISKIANLDVHYQQLVQRNQRSEREVQRFTEQKKIQQEIKIAKAKRMWTAYEQARTDYIIKKEKYQALLKEKEQATRDTKPLNQMYKKYEEEMHVANNKVGKMREEMHKSAKNLKDLQEYLQCVVEKMNDEWANFRELTSEEKERVSKMENLEIVLESWRKELGELQDTDVQPEINNVTKEINGNLKNIQHIDQQKASCINQKQQMINEIRNNERHCATLRNMSKRRLEVMQRRNRDCYKAVMWLRENKSLFEGVIHEPIMLVINMKDGRHAELLENHIAFRDMFAFVCENQNDNKKFIDAVREKMKLKINVVLAPRNTTYHPRRSIEQLRNWGFGSYLRELFDAPGAVMAFLCKQYRVHDIPVGSDTTKKIVDQVTKSSNTDLFYIPSATNQPGCRYSVKRSKYSGNSIVGNSALRPAEYLNSNVDIVRINEFENKIKALKEGIAEEDVKIGKYEKKHNELEAIDQHLRSNLKVLFDKRQKRITLENKIQLKEASLEEIKNNQRDLEVEKQRVEKKTNELTLERTAQCYKFVKSNYECVEMEIETGKQLLKVATISIKKDRIEEKLAKWRLENVDLLQEIERSAQTMNDVKQYSCQLLKEARSSLNGQEPPNSNPRLKAAFRKYPDDLPELDSKIHELEARLECTGDTDPNAFAEYQTRKKDIEKVSGKLETFKKELEDRRSNMETVKERWITPMKELVSKINAKFGEAFAMMGCAGEVDLHSDNPEDFDQYGIRIRVKFRAESELQELNPFRQSGGERSVSTMLYLVALQKMSTCPFRLVDEINQGMDPHNERRVFDVIVRSSSEPSSSQYFLITPKLLPNLTYGRFMSVHCIYNGENTPNHEKWKLKKMLRRRRQFRYVDE